MILIQIFSILHIQGNLWIMFALNPTVKYLLNLFISGILQKMNSDNPLKVLFDIFLLTFQNSKLKKKEKIKSNLPLCSSGAVWGGGYWIRRLYSLIIKPTWPHILYWCDFFLHLLFRKMGIIVLKDILFCYNCKKNGWSKTAKLVHILIKNINTGLKYKP